MCQSMSSESQKPACFQEFKLAKHFRTDWKPCIMETRLDDIDGTACMLFGICYC